MRAGLRTRLEKLGTPGDWSHITSQVSTIYYLLHVMTSTDIYYLLHVKISTICYMLKYLLISTICYMLKYLLIYTDIATCYNIY